MTDMPSRASLSFAVVCVTLAAMPLFAQPPESDATPIAPLPLGTILLTLPSPHVSEAGLWEVRFSHRFAEARGEGLHSLWGLDNGANVTMSLSWFPARDLELSIARSNTLEDYELAGKYVVMQQARSIPLSLALRGGVDYRAERDLEDRSSFFAQAIVGRRLTPRLELFAVPTWATDAGRANANETSFARFDHAFNVPLGAAFLIAKDLTLVAEVIPPNGDLPEDSDLGWSAGIKRAIGGHHFEVLVTNSAATTASQYVSTTWLGEPLDSGGIRIGFNIERQFGRPHRRSR